MLIGLYVSHFNVGGEWGSWSAMAFGANRGTTSASRILFQAESQANPNRLRKLYPTRAFLLVLTATCKQTRIAEGVGTCHMATHTCPDCDSPGEGNCRRCHGEGRILPDKSFGKFAAEIPCSRCKGTGDCPTCGGTGEIEADGESG